MEEKYVGIISSSSNDIDEYYKNIAKDLSNYLAIKGLNLTFGGCSTSMMGNCYQEFIKQGRKVYAFTNEKYKDDLDNLDRATGIVCETTFEVKKGIFENSDIIVALPGGVGTYSEILSFIEEKRSNDKSIPIEIYDEDGYYLPLIETLKIMELKHMIDNNVYSQFNISHNFEEFKEHIDSYLLNTKERTK